MQPCKLPVPSDSDVKIFLNTSTQEMKTSNEDNGVLHLFQGRENHDEITYINANAEVGSEPRSAGLDHTNPSTRLYLLLLAQARRSIPLPKVYTDWRALNRWCTDWLLTRSINAQSWDPAAWPSSSALSILALTKMTQRVSRRKSNHSRTRADFRQADIRDDDCWHSLRLLQMLIELSLVGGDMHRSFRND